MARTHTFKGSSSGYGYAAFIEDDQLVITEDWGREGGVIYRGPYACINKYVLNELKLQAPKLYNSIVQYFDERETEEPKKETTIHQFKDNRDIYGYGYFGYIENGQLVLCNEQPREGGVYFRGSYSEAVAKGHMASLKIEDKTLYNDIEKYFIKHRVNNQEEQLKKKYDFDEETKTVLFKVQLFMDNRQVHNALVRGRSQAGVVEKLMPKIPEVLMLQTWDAMEFAVRSEKISAVVFVED